MWVSIIALHALHVVLEAKENTGWAVFIRKFVMLDLLFPVSLCNFIDSYPLYNL